MSQLEFDTPVVAEIREHLLRLSRASIAPQHGGRHAHVDSPEEAAVISRFRPFAELLLLVASADGHIDETERKVILGAFRAITGGRVRGATLLSLETEIRSTIAGGDREALLEDVCTALAGDRRDAELGLTLASAVALADRTVDLAEAELIRTLASWLAIPPARVGELLGGREAWSAS